MRKVGNAENIWNFYVIHVSFLSKELYDAFQICILGNKVQHEVNVTCLFTHYWRIKIYTI